MKQNISTVELFPRYATREAFEKETGKPCPPWDPRRAPKYWFDPDAAGKATGVRRMVPYLFPAQTETGGWVADAEGNIATETVSLSVAEAATVNIPEPGPKPGDMGEFSRPEVPIPIRPLRADERLRFRPFEGLHVLVIDPSIPAPPPVPGDLTAVLAALEEIQETQQRILARLR